jgi:hypothetical protein
MHIAPQQLRPLANVELSTNEAKILEWLRSAKWEAQQGAHSPQKTKVPEYYSGVRLYSMQGHDAAQGALEIFLKKLQYQNVISKLDIYPLAGHGASRFLTLPKADLENLAIPGKEAEDEE